MEFTGGSALHNGVQFSSTHKIVTVTINKDDEFDTKIEDNLAVKKKLLFKGERFIKKIPFIRGFYDLFRYNIELIVVFIITLFVDLINNNYDKISDLISNDPDGTKSEIVFVILNVLIIIVLIILSIKSIKEIINHLKFLKLTHEFHGAEHKTVNAYYDHKDLSIEKVRRASRVAYGCGTSFLAFWITCSFFIFILL